MPGCLRPSQYLTLLQLLFTHTTEISSSVKVCEGDGWVHPQTRGGEIILTVYYKNDQCFTNLL